MPGITEDFRKVYGNPEVERDVNGNFKDWRDEDGYIKVVM